jgi:hypothetical protein
MKRTFKFSLVARGTDKVFDEELGPGILAVQEAEFNLTPKQYKSPMFVASLLDVEREFIEGLVEVKIEEIK